LATLDEVLAKLKAAPQAEIEAVDWDAPEAGQFPPRLLPGIYDFVFHLEDQNPFDAVEIPKGSGNLSLQMGYKADILDQHSTNAPQIVTLRFQRVSTFKSEKMPISAMNDLVRNLGQRLSAHPDWQDYTDLFQRLSGQARGHAEVGWRRYCKACNITVSTHPRKGDVKWPRDAANKPVQIVACPGCSDKGYGREEIVRFRVAVKAVSA
jgi:hypothetical protein